KPPEGSRNPYDYPLGRVPNYFDGLTGEQVCAEFDARMEKLFHQRFAPIIAKVVAKTVSSYITKRLEGALFYRGVYQDGTEYGEGSLVQHAGTAWVSTVEKATTKPGTSSEWRMLIKTKGSANDEDE